MGNNLRRRLKWTGLIGGGVIVVLLLLMFLLPKIYSNAIDQQVRILLKDNVKGDVEYEKIDISFYRKFPFLTATMDKPTLQGVILDSALDDNLFEAESISLGVNLFALIQGKLSFDRIYIDKPLVFIYVNDQGLANYDIFYTSDSLEQEQEKQGELGLKINRLQIKDAEIIYNDLASGLSFVASDFDYVGRGDMNQAVFDLKSVARINSFDFNFEGVHYIKEKPILAKLETLVDTKSLTFGFEKNSIKIKGLPVDFKGHFGFIESGYDMLFDVKTEKATFEELLSVIPPEYQQWLDNTDISGLISGKLLLEGKYIVSEGISPNLDFSMVLEDGFIHNKQVDTPLEKLNLDMHFSMPGLHLNNNTLDIKTLNFVLGQHKSDVVWKSSGLDSLLIQSQMNINMDLGLFNHAVGINGFQMKGLLNFSADLDGVFHSKEVYRKVAGKAISHKKLLSVPRFDVTTSLSNGFFKFASLPQGLKGINFNMKAQSKDSNWRKAFLDISNIELLAMDNVIRGKFKVDNFIDFPVKGELNATVDLVKLKEFIPIEHLNVAGLIDIHTDVSGNFLPKQKKYPLLKAEVKVSQGYLQLAKVPQLPIEDIELHTIINSDTGTLSGIKVDIEPLEFKFAGEDFKLSANLADFTNLNYTLKSKGVLNIGDLYKVFPIPGLEVTGKVQTNLFLKGTQADVAAGNFAKLKNAGKLSVEDIEITTSYLPKTFSVSSGVFTFFRERMKFDKFNATYGNSSFDLNGYLTDVISFLTKKGTLKGSFTLNTPFLDVDEFMLVSTTDKQEFTSKEELEVNKAQEVVEKAVIQIPKNVELEFKANAKRIKYLTYDLSAFHGDLKLDKGKVFLEEADFELIGTKVQMQAAYEPLGLDSAIFDYQISAQDFDIQRAYKEVPLFREMVSMAESAYGKVSLDYSLKGKLNKDMYPILPSIEGQGVLVLEDIRFKGFKLLGAIADKTDSKAMEKANVSQVDIFSSISNNVITIDRTKMKMAGFRPRFEGQVSLDGKINIGLRLGLPPLGLVGIPMKITGTSDDFDIKLGKYRPSEVLGGSTKYDEEDELEEEIEQELQQSQEQSQEEIEQLAV